jgi:tRNA pseudouridine13 synthase
MTVHALQSVVFNKSLHARIEDGLPISRPVAGDLVGRIDEKGQLEASSCVVVEERTLPRIARNCQLGRLVTTGPLPGSEINTCEGVSGTIEAKIIEQMKLHEADWNVSAIPRLSTRGTRRALVTEFNELAIDTVPIANDETMGERWKSGPGSDSRWHPEGACIRFRFVLSSGSYATTLLREFMQGPLSQL